MILNAEPDITVVGEAADGAKAISLTAELGPEVVLMDVRMPYEFDALVVNGRYLDEIDLYVVGGRLTEQQAAAEFGSHFNRLRHS